MLTFNLSILEMMLEFLSKKFIRGLFVLSPSILLGILGATYSQGQGALIGVGLGLVFLLIWIAVSERIVMLIFQASPEKVSPGLKHSLEVVALQDRSLGLPRLRIYPNVFPQFWVSRSLWGRQGTILLSQGLLSLLNEEELRAILRDSLRRLSRRRSWLLGFNLVSFYFLSLLTPKIWMELIFVNRSLTPEEERSLNSFSLLRFWCLYPVLRFLLDWISEIDGKKRQALEDPIYNVAIEKISQSAKFWGSCPTLTGRLRNLSDLSY